MSKRPPTLLIISQVFIPDPASLGQHMADAAREMVKRGWRVIVLTADRGYDDPSQHYARREVIDGIEIRRFPLSSLGKTSIIIRLIGGAIFLAQALMYGLFLRHLTGLLISTSPPTCPAAAVMLGIMRRVPICYWVMDLNPDQMVELGIITERSVPARIFNCMNRSILKRAKCIITLDEFMARRISAKRDVSGKMVVLPPWPHEGAVQPVEHDDNPFRERLGVRRDQRLIMYSGNHAIGNPVSTILKAALRLEDEERALFVFIGGGVGKKEIDDLIARDHPRNILSLPYQPLSELRFSLSAADVHLVSIGASQVGIVHPCKIYGAMAAARPILALGPRESHIGRIVEQFGAGWCVEHEDVEGAIRIIKAILDQSHEDWRAMCRRSREAIDSELGKDQLCGRFCDAVEQAIIGSTGRHSSHKELNSEA